MSTREVRAARGRWHAVIAATCALQLSYWPVVSAVTASTVAGRATAGALALGLALVPAVLLVLAFTSGQHRAPGAVLRGLGVFLLLGVPLALADVVVGLVVGFAAAAVVALHRDEDLPPTRSRLVATIAAGAYALVLVVALPPLAVLSGAVLPFVAVALADEVDAGRYRDRAVAAAGGEAR